MNFEVLPRSLPEANSGIIAYVATAMFAINQEHQSYFVLLKLLLYSKWKQSVMFLIQRYFSFSLFGKAGLILSREPDFVSLLVRICLEFYKMYDVKQMTPAVRTYCF